MLYTAYLHEGPAAVRYPRGPGRGVPVAEAMSTLEIGKGVKRRDGHGTAILNFGVLLGEAERAAEVLDATLADMRWVKPLDETMVIELARSHERLVTVEENALAGGAGSAITELLAREGIDCPVRHIAIPDRWMDHASQDQNRAAAGLTAEAIIAAGTLDSTDSPAAVAQPAL